MYFGVKWIISIFFHKSYKSPFPFDPIFYMNATTYQNDVPQNIRIDKPQFQKMIFIMNALEQGWVVKKAQESYIFTKKHENRREIFQENYLEKFVEGNTQFPSDFSYRK